MTPYSEDNQEFSDIAHMSARLSIYPKLFKCDGSAISYESANVADGGRSAILDGEMGIDKIVNVSVETLRAPIVFTVQERFRRIENKRFTDITITEFNHATGRISELYKMTAGVFVYGFFDESTQRFERWVAADVNKILYGVVTGGLPYTKKNNPRSEQDFVCIEVADLFSGGCVLMGVNKHLWGMK